MVHPVRLRVDPASGSVRTQLSVVVLPTGCLLCPANAFSLWETSPLLRANAALRVPCHAAYRLPAEHSPVRSWWETGCDFAAPALFPVPKSDEGSGQQ